MPFWSKRKPSTVSWSTCDTLNLVQGAVPSFHLPNDSTVIILILQMKKLSEVKSQHIQGHGAAAKRSGPRFKPPDELQSPHSWPLYSATSPPENKNSWNITSTRSPQVLLCPCSALKANVLADTCHGSFRHRRSQNVNTFVRGLPLRNPKPVLEIALAFSAQRGIWFLRLRRRNNILMIPLPHWKAGNYWLKLQVC